MKELIPLIASTIIVAAIPTIVLIEVVYTTLLIRWGKKSK